MTQYPDIWNALARDFDARLVRERPAGGGKVPYITARTAMNRLDSVLGFENWSDVYERDPGGSDNILCRLTIRLPDGSTVTKCDVGSPGKTGDDGEDDKGAVSDAFKRAAVKFGVGRSLYGEGCYLAPGPAEAHAVAPPEAARPADPPPAKAPAKERNKWGNPPSERPAASNGNGHGAGDGKPRTNWPPRTGRALFAWLKEQDERHDVGLLKYVGGWGKLQDFPGRVVDWDARQVDLAVKEALRKLEGVQGEAYEEALTN